MWIRELLKHSIDTISKQLKAKPSYFSFPPSRIPKQDIATVSQAKNKFKAEP